MNWSSAALAAAKLLGLAESAGETATGSALKQSVTLEKILQGVKIAESLPWTEIFSALENHFSDPEKTVSTIEDVLQALATFIPGVIPFEEAAQVIALLCRLNFIRAGNGSTAPNSGSGAALAPFI